MAFAMSVTHLPNARETAGKNLSNDADEALAVGRRASREYLKLRLAMAIESGDEVTGARLIHLLDEVLNGTLAAIKIERAS
jgi:hypothetical protein